MTKSMIQSLDLYDLHCRRGWLDVFDGGSLASGFGPASGWNLFDGGRVRNAVRVEEAGTQ